MSGDGTGRGGAGLPDEPADGTDWLLSQLDADDTEAIETQPDADAGDEQPSAAVAPVPADDDDRTRVLPVIGDAAASPVPEPVPAEPQWSAPAVPDAPAAPMPATPTAAESTAAESTPTAVESLPAPVEQTPAAAEPTPATAPGEFASETELLAWWQSQVPNTADDTTPAPAPSTPDVPSAEPAAPATPAASADPVPEEAPVRSEGLRHPNALELPVVPPTPAPASPVPPARNELTVDTDSVLQHAPAGTFRPAPTNPVVLPPVDDEPWSLGSDDADVAPAAPEDVSTAVLPTARALAADDPAAWAEVEAEETGATTATSTPVGGTPAAPLPPTAPPVAPTPTSADHEVPSASPTPDTEVQDDDLPDGSWSLSETFGDDVLGGETVVVRDTTIDASAPADTGLDEAPDEGVAADDAWTAESAAAEASAPRTDPLAWLTEPFGATFGAAPAAPEEQTAEEPLAEPVDESPQQLDSADESVIATVTDEATPPSLSEPVQPTADSEPEPEPASDGIVASEPITPAAPFRWDTVAAASPVSAAEPTSPADVPWPETVPDVDAEPLDETRPFDSLGGPGFSALAGAAAAAAAVHPAPTPVPVADAEPGRDDAPVDDDATDTADVPPAFGPPTPKAERSITELISLDGVQPEPTVSPFGTAPFVWDLAPNDALDPLVHAAPTTQPIPVPPVEWEGAESSAVSAESPSELALEGEVPDAAFIAGDVQPFAPGLAAVTLGRPLVDGPGDEFASWTDDATETDSSATDDAPIVPAANDTVDLFPTLSLGGFDAAVAAGGLAAAGAATAAGAASGLGSGEDTADTDDTETSADLDGGAAPATAPTPVTETPAPESPAFAVDPEELDDEFDEEIVEFDAVPLAAAGVTSLPSFVPDGAVADGATDPSADAAASDGPLAPGSIDPEPVGEPEPVSEELRLESLFDLGPETDAVEVASTDDAATDGASAATPPADTEQADDTAADAAAEPSDQPDAAAAGAGSARSLADAFAAEGGWSLQADAVADPDLPLAPIPGLVAADGTDVDGRDPDGDTGGSRRNGAHVAGEDGGAPHTAPVAETDAASNTAPTPLTPASVSVFGAHAAAVPSQGPVADVPQTAPAALPGETVAFPELDGASALTTPAAAAGIVGATLPPQATQSAPERDLPEYRGEHADQGIPKALIWAVVGLGAAVLLLLAFYFGTLVGAANAAGAAADATMPSVSAGWSTAGAPDTV
ncbi:hypothetical protein [Plantibacter sp. ME-Dv--P-122b]|uniref:hypothetical protein n=1 Tax=Plantibacter sp. ME-Dv--P-122b TaxID=3040300 RepID=UPI00254B33FB|nr:hypothetical protein [Plantibacter sp. ME-Dv--P-122b]